MGIAESEGVRTLIELAAREDLGAGDITSDLLPSRRNPAAFRLVSRQSGVFAGREVAPLVLARFDPAIELDWTRFGVDGAQIPPEGIEIAIVRGPLGPLLSVERVLLNFLGRLCGVASATRAYVDAVAGTGATILDTRKTIPGWRELDKYAVRCGGGKNHRRGLYDAVLVKDNHLAGIETSRLPGAVFEMMNRIPGGPAGPAFVEVEADTLEQFDQLLKIVGIQIVLLDNFSLPDLRAAVARRDELGLRGKVELEASGGITLETVRVVAETGVERISVGAITHSAAALDLSLERA